MILMRNKNINKIEFYPWTEEVFQKITGPDSSIKHVPEYWKRMPRFLGSNSVTIGNNEKNKNRNNVTLKHCMPFLDALTTGYQYLTWADIHVTNNNGVAEVTMFADDQPIFNERSTDELPTPANHYDKHLAWCMHWGIKTPPGWSTLFTHPMNRTDLPFTTVSGIINTDKYFASGNVSVHIKEGFEGIIPKGTPYMQAVPIKRADWVSSINHGLQEEAHWQMHRKRNFSHGYYRKNAWESNKFE